MYKKKIQSIKKFETGRFDRFKSKLTIFLQNGNQNLLNSNFYNLLMYKKSIQSIKTV